MRLLVLALVLVTASVLAGDLPKMSRINENKILKKFPLDKIDKIKVFETYGPPTSKMDGLPHKGAAWTYGRPDMKTFTFVFHYDKVHDIIVRYPGPYKARTARKKQGIEK